MSHFVKITTAIRDTKALIRALGRMGFDKSKIEINDIAKNLYGYKGDVREQKAHVILRRKYVGSLSNDIGFEKVNGVYTAHISEFDHGQYDDNWQKKLFTYYGVEKTKMELESKGLGYMEDVEQEGRPRLKIYI